MSVHIVRRLLTVDEYHRMGEVGILQEQNLELINGEIVEMSPVGSDHASIVEKFKDLLTINLFQKAIVRVQNPIRLSKYSEPEPDLALVKYHEDYYKTAHPSPKDVIVLMEVADSSLEYDLEVKMPLYAQSQIPEFWVINIRLRQIEVYSIPADGTYKMKRIYKNEDEISIPGFNLSFQANQLV